MIKIKKINYENQKYNCYSCDETKALYEVKTNNKNGNNNYVIRMRLCQICLCELYEQCYIVVNDEVNEK